MFKPKSALQVARSPQPYQVPLYFPPYPTILPKTNFDNSYKVANALRKYQNINTAELARLRGDLTAYRQEAQTAFRKNVAFPRASAIPATAPPNAPPTADDIISGSDIVAEDINTEAEDTNTETELSIAEQTTDKEGQKPSFAELSELYQRGEAIPIEAFQRFSPRATQEQRRQRRTRSGVYKDNATNRRLGRVGLPYGSK